MACVDVSAVIVTRGDVDLSPVLDSLPRDWQKVVWNNSQREDMAVYGRYAAIEECEHELIFVQDDDCVLEDPAALLVPVNLHGDLSKRNFLVANMPQRFRDSGFYEGHCLVGFGAIFHRDLPAAAFDRFMLYESEHSVRPWVRERDYFGGVDPYRQWEFYRTCDIVFTGLTHRVLLDLPYRDLPHAHADNRMWKQTNHVGERRRMLDLVRRVRDGEPT